MDYRSAKLALAAACIAALGPIAQRNRKLLNRAELAAYDAAVLVAVKNLAADPAVARDLADEAGASRDAQKARAESARAEKLSPQRTQRPPSTSGSGHAAPAGALPLSPSSSVPSVPSVANPSPEASP